MSRWSIWVARWYARADRCERAVLNALQAVHEGVWLGVVGPAALRAATSLYYEGAAKYHDREYNLSGLQGWEEDIIRRHFASCRSVLVASAGGGREAIALRRQGFEVDAFDCTDGLVATANHLADAEGVPLRFVLAEPDAVPGGFGTFDAAVIGWGGYMHVPRRESRVAFLRQLRGHLRATAPLLVSFFERNPSARRFRYIRAIASAVRRVRFSREPVELGDSLAGSFDHHFTRDELSSELEAGGFEMVEYTSTPYAHAVARATPT
ncbi:MAG: class I SAM-dependent methyltransferase [Acidobacteriia bacterium]|nr:class I SAM-dependent methyltransferase [Terriglobia bacterium]